MGFRAYAARLGDRLGLEGYVLNRDDGCVEALAQGNPGAVSEFVDFMRSGPPAARVDNCAVTEEPLRGDLERFSIGW